MEKEAATWEATKQALGQEHPLKCSKADARFAAMMQCIILNLALDDNDETATLKVSSPENGTAYMPGVHDLEQYIEHIKGCPKTGVVSFMQLMKGRNREPWDSPWHIQFTIGTWSGVVRDFLSNLVVTPNEEQYWSFRRWNRKPASWGNPQGF